MDDDQGNSPSPTTQDETEAIERAAHEAVERGVDVREEVRALTTAALSGGRLDPERARRVIDAAMAGISRGAAGSAHDARVHAREAAHGIDEALAHAAHALQLTLSEARERFEDFGEEDLRKAEEDLRLLQALLGDAVARLARSGDAAMRAVWADVEKHWRASGAEVGRQASQAFSEAAAHLRRAGEAQVATSWDAALGAGAQLADVASGMLAGVAEALGQARRKPPDDKS